MVTGAATIAGFLLGPTAAVTFVPPPGWAMDAVPTDEGTDADGMGPSSSLGVSLPAGVEEASPGADIGAYNVVGPSPVYARMWRGNQAAVGYESPGLSAGWTDNYDLSIVNNGSSSTLTYPNGAAETLSGSSGTLSTPAGAPYTANYNGTTLTYTLQYKDRTQYTFTQFTTGAGNYAANTYLLTGITNIVGHSISLVRDTTGTRGHRISAIRNVNNDGSLGTTLLSFNYDSSGLLTSIQDKASPNTPERRQVNYAFTSGNLSNVSQIVAYAATGSDLWQYGYQTINSQPYLNTVKTPDPSNSVGYSTATVNYDSSGHVLSHQDANGAKRLYSFGSSSVLVQVLNPNGKNAQQMSRTFSATKNTDTGFLDAGGHQATISYAGSPSPYLPSVVTNRNSQTTTLTYDTTNTYGNVLTVTPPSNAARTPAPVNYTYEYPTATNGLFPLGQVSSVQETGKQATNLSYYNLTDTNGAALNGLLKEMDVPYPDTSGGSSQVATSYSYLVTSGKSLGNIASITAPAPHAAGSVTTSFGYTTDGTYTQSEAVGEPLTVTDPNSNVTHFRYDGRGNVITEIDASGYETDYFYNLANQVVAVVYPQTGTATSAFTYTSYEYVGGPVTNVALYQEGTLTSQPTPGSAFPTFSGSPFRKTIYTYGPEGEVATVSDLIGTLSSYTYDGRYRTASVSDGKGNTTYYTYTGNGSLNQVQYPNSGGNGTTNLSPGTPDTLSYSYDANQNVTGETDGRGVVTTYTRNVDPESLVTQIAYSSLPSYVQTIGTISFAYDSYGRRTALTDYSGSKTYAYDDLDEMTSLTANFTDTAGNPGPQGQTLSFTHYRNGQRASLTLPTSISNVFSVNSGGLSYDYDDGGRLTALNCPWVKGNGLTSPEAITYGYLSNDWLHTQNNTAANTTYTYNSRGFLTNLSNVSNTPYSASGTQISAYAMTAAGSYDAVGNRLLDTATVPAHGSAPDLSRTLTYSYDQRDQLTGETSAHTAGSAGSPGVDYDYSGTGGFAYDNAFNPTLFRGASTGGGNFDNQLTSLGTFDGNGNAGASSGGSPSYTDNMMGGVLMGATLTYDPLDRLNVISSTPFSARYDGDSLRTVKNSAAGPFYYLNDEDGTPVVEEQYTTGAATPAYIAAVNVFGADGLRERFLPGGISTPTGFFYGYSFDPQGSTQARSSGTFSMGLPYPYSTVELYDGYGKFLYARSPTPGGMSLPYAPDPVGFGGQYGYYTDTETHLQSLTHRYYDAGAGRFVNRDPIGYQGGINLYGFAGNNPIMGQDPSGLNPFTDFVGGASDNVNPKLFVEGVVALGQYLSGPGSAGTKAGTLGKGLVNGLNPLTARNSHELGQRIGGDVLLFTGVGALSKARALGAAARAVTETTVVERETVDVVITARPGSMQTVDPRGLIANASRNSLEAGRLNVQRGLIRSGIKRHTPVEVTEDGIIADGHHGAFAAGEAGQLIDVRVVPIKLNPGKPLMQLPIRK